MDLVPTLTDRKGPVYLRIVEALAADIESGRPARGQQLPTHRTLAKALGVDLTTVTRAYTEARNRGLTEARVGQGTFVAESLSQSRRMTTGPWALRIISEGAAAKESSLTVTIGFLLSVPTSRRGSHCQCDVQTKKIFDPSPERRRRRQYRGWFPQGYG